MSRERRNPVLAEDTKVERVLAGGCAYARTQSAVVKEMTMAEEDEHEM